MSDLHLKVPIEPELGIHNYTPRFVETCPDNEALYISLFNHCQTICNINYNYEAVFL